LGARYFHCIKVSCSSFFRGIDANCVCFGFDDQIIPLTRVHDGIIIKPAIYLAMESWVQARRNSATAGRTRSPSLNQQNGFSAIN
jgi:hypothetical protein